MTDDERLEKFVALCRELVERDGQRLYRARNSPAIYAVRIFPWGDVLWIKRVRQRLVITLSLQEDNARTCVYDNHPEDSVLSGTWGPWLEPYEERVQQIMVLDALARA